MKPMPCRLSLAACLTVACAALSGARAQGTLTPPGAPAPSMRTLTQVEPRFPVSRAPVTLNRPGSYYLTTNLNDTVTVAADNVTLDLMGFTITAPSGGTAVTLSAGKNLSVLNGVLAIPDADGVGLSAAEASGEPGGRVEALRVTGGRYGLLIGNGFTVQDCHVTAANTAIRVTGNSLVRACRLEGSVTGLRVSGKGARIENNVVRGNTNNYSLVAGNQLCLLLCEIPETLSWPCSATLAGPLSTERAGVNGITVEADDVTIDLAGHALTGPGSASGHGIFQGDTRRRLRILNGTVNHWRGAGKGGIYASGESIRVTDVQAVTNAIGCYLSTAGEAVGCEASGNLNSGFSLGYSCALARCDASDNQECGVFAVGNARITDCTMLRNTEEGICMMSVGQISRCHLEANFHGIQGQGGMVSISDCTLANNRVHGILSYNGTVVSRCLSIYNGSRGISVGDACTVSDSTASWNEEEGFYAAGSCALSVCVADANGAAGIKVVGKGDIRDCKAADNGGCGIVAGNGARISGCLASQNTEAGVCVADDGAVSDCVADYNTLDGFKMAGNTTVARCAATENGSGGDGAGFHATGMGNRIEGNQAIGNDRGFDIDQGGNFIARNTSRWNSPNWDVASGNVCLAVMANAGGGAISGDAGGASPGSTDPNANFTY